MPERSWVVGWVGGSRETSACQSSHSSVGGRLVFGAAVVVTRQVHVVWIQSSVGCSATWDAAHSGPDDVIALRLGLRVFWQREASTFPRRHRLETGDRKMILKWTTAVWVSVLTCYYASGSAIWMWLYCCLTLTLYIMTIKLLHYYYSASHDSSSVRF